MAYTKDIADANTYYAETNHIRSNDWSNYTTGERTGGLAQAQRELEVYLARDACDPSADDRYRDDYAIFEQSLFILDETVRTLSSTTGAQMIKTVDSNERDKFFGVTICPQAMRYLALPRMRIVRGS